MLCEKLEGGCSVNDEQDMKNNVEIYQSAEGKVSVKVLYELETVWLTQRQMGELFATTPENVLMHLKNICKEQEFDECSTFND